MAILAIDLGTSGAKAALTSDAGSVTTTAPYPTLTADGGVVEQDPREWLGAVARIAAALPGPYEAVVLNGQMQDLIRYRGGELVGNAWLYSDTRSAAEAQHLHAVLPQWEEWTGNEQSATSNAAMLLATSTRVQLSGAGETTSAAAPAGATAPADEVLFSPSGVVARALGLGNHVDPTTASTTGLFANGAWHPEIAAAAGVALDVLPEVSQGYLGRAAANELGIPFGTPIYLAPGDAGATTAGIVGTHPGADYLYLGTTGWHAKVTDTPAAGAIHRLSLGASTLQIAAVLAAGSAAQWARGVFLGGIAPERADEHLSRRGYSGLVALPSIFGERFPVRDDALAGAVVGTRASTTGADMYRAVLESVVLNLAAGFDPDEPGPLPVVGGGAKSRPWMEIVADISGRDVVLFDDSDAALHGAAMEVDETLEPLSAHPVAVVQPEAHGSYQGALERQRALIDFVQGL